MWDTLRKHKGLIGLLSLAFISASHEQEVHEAREEARADGERELVAKVAKLTNADGEELDDILQQLDSDEEIDEYE